MTSGDAVHAQQQPRQWVDGELLVAFRAGVGAKAKDKLYRDESATFIEDVGRNTRIVRLRVGSAGMEARMRRLQRRAQVKFVEKNYVFEPALVPNDEQFASQWHLPLIQAPQAWDTTQGATNSVIAILDSGIDASHPDLAGKLLAGRNTYSNSTDTSDAYGHGTEVAGAAATWTNNGQGVAGVAGAAPLMPVRVTDSKGRATSASLANGITWAVDHGARILNLSFSGIAGNSTIRTAAQYANDHGALVVAASGNCACVDATPENPYVLSVSATDESDALGGYSSTGPFVDLAAPGSNILTTARGGLYIADTGTSLASPIVAGTAALMLAANATLTPPQMTQLLESTATDLGSGGYDQSFGYGRVNAAAAVAAAASFTPPPDTTNPTVAMTTLTDGATLSGTAVVDVTASDNVGVTKVDLFVDDALFATDSTSPFSFAWDTTAVANGSHTLRAVATDAAGNNASTATFRVTVSNAPPDTTPPTVSITSPADGATVSGTVTVAASASDNVGVAKVELRVDGTLNATLTAAPYSFAWNASTASAGAHTLLVTATDAAGNSASASRSVTVASNQAPIAANDAFSAPARPRQQYTPQVFNVLSNDRDPDGSLSPSTVSIASVPSKGGTVSVNADGTVAYTPRRSWSGTETFTYRVKDNLGASSNPATVTVTVR